MTPLRPVVPSRRPRLAIAAIGSALALLGCTLVRGAPTDGRYEGEMCVATNDNPVSCGPAEVWLANGLAQVQVSDIVYRLHLKKDGRMDLVLMHGTMQIDEFSTRYVWTDRVLTFADPDKPVRYRIRFGDHTPRPG